MTCDAAISSSVEHLLSSFRLPQSGGDMMDPFDIPSPPIPHAPNPPPVNPPPYPGLRGKKKKKQMRGRYLTF